MWDKTERKTGEYAEAHNANSLGSLKHTLKDFPSNLILINIEFTDISKRGKFLAKFVWLDKLV